jgi:hypothetical protein
MKPYRTVLNVLSAILLFAGAAGIEPAMAGAAHAPAPSSPVPGAVAGEEPRAPEPPTSRSDTQLFQVIMVLGRTSGGTTSEGLSVSAKKALDDLRDFLPYRSYALLDTVLLRTARSAETTMRGPDGREFGVSLDLRKEKGNGEPELHVRRFRVVDRTGSHRSEPMEIPSKDGQAVLPPVSPRTIISTSFGIDIGETVVVGSSRLDGGEKALILLVTAIP